MRRLAPSLALLVFVIACRDFSVRPGEDESTQPHTHTDAGHDVDAGDGLDGGNDPRETPPSWDSGFAPLPDGGPAPRVDADVSKRDAGPDAPDAMPDGQPELPDANLPDARAELDAAVDPLPDAGRADAGTTKTQVVRGRLIDFYGAPVPNVEITIGASRATTDHAGTFEIADVAPPYDVSFIITIPSGPYIKHGWLFKGLTRPDPTLQVTRGAHPIETQVRVQTVHRASPFPDDVRDALAITGEYGHYQRSLEYMNSPSSVSVTYHGKPATLRAHALLWQIDPSTELPIAYLAHSAGTIPLAAPDDVTVFDLSPQDITTKSVSGSVTSGLSDAVFLTAFVDFADGVSAEILDQHDMNLGGPFELMVPDVPGVRTSLVASRSAGYDATAFVRGVIPGVSDVTLTMPTPFALLAPSVNAADVDDDTVFRWEGEGQVHVLEVQSRTVNHSWSVVTREGETTVPTFDGTHVMSNSCTWTVQKHGAYRTIDDAAGPEGMLHAWSDTASPRAAGVAYQTARQYFARRTR